MYFLTEKFINNQVSAQEEKISGIQKQQINQERRI